MERRGVLGVGAVCLELRVAVAAAAAAAAATWSGAGEIAGAKLSGHRAGVTILYWYHLVGFTIFSCHDKSILVIVCSPFFPVVPLVTLDSVRTISHSEVSRARTTNCCCRDGKRCGNRK